MHRRGFQRTDSLACVCVSLLFACVPECSPLWFLDGRGKRSVALDLKRTDPRAAFEKMLASSDCFVSNLREKALIRLNLGPVPAGLLATLLITLVLRPAALFRSCGARTLHRSRRMCVCMRRSAQIMARYPKMVVARVTGYGRYGLLSGAARHGEAASACRIHRLSAPPCIFPVSQGPTSTCPPMSRLRPGRGPDWLRVSARTMRSSLRCLPAA